mmetsp:Transcript_20246/g.56136  ORF Transcript_20246/g.56136 Transcript_20246/m.56136 type:complete len:83 (-) Transcript_20246:87-335(-)
MTHNRWQPPTPWREEAPHTPRREPPLSLLQGPRSAWDTISTQLPLHREGEKGDSSRRWGEKLSGGGCRRMQGKDARKREAAC